MQPIRLSAALIVVIGFAGSAAAQQPTPADMQAALAVVQTQRNRLADEQVEMAVRFQRQATEYEARLSTAMQWLKEAQTKGGTK